MDPCDLRPASPATARCAIWWRGEPRLFEFAIRTALAEHDLDSAEGRRGGPAAVRADGRAEDQGPMLRDEYARRAGRLGGLGRRRAGDGLGTRGSAERGGCPSAAGAPPTAAEAVAGAPRRHALRRAAGPDPRRPHAVAAARERSSRRCSTRRCAGPVFDSLTVESFTHPGIRARCGRPSRRRAGRVGGAAPAASGSRPSASRRRAPRRAQPGQRARRGGHQRRRRRQVAALHRAACWPGCRKCGAGRQIAEVKSKLHRMSLGGPGRRTTHALFGDLWPALETYRRKPASEQALARDDLTRMRACIAGSARRDDAAIPLERHRR